MPIYEYYCPDNHTVYQFYAKTLAQGQTTPPCPDNPAFRLQKMVSSFAVTRGRPDPATAPANGAAGEPDAAGDPAEDARMAAAMQAMEREFASVDENDPRAMGRMMRRMAELTGEKLDGEMEAVVRRLEEGADPEALEAELGDDDNTRPDAEAPGANPPREPRHRFRLRRSLPPRRDPQLYDYPA